MLFWTVLATALLPILITASPTPLAPRADSTPSPNDLEILNFALTLEHLENAFYSQLGKYTQDDFLDSKLPEWARDRWIQIRDHERVHAKFISTAIGAADAKAVIPCRYKFPVDDVISFAKMSLGLETLCTSAYNGLLRYIQNKDYTTISGSIMAVEARQAAWINSAIFNKNAWGVAFDIPLTFRQAYTMVVNFIESCPSENAALLPSGSTRVFPQLAFEGDLEPGRKAQAKFTGIKTCGKQCNVVFKTGFGQLPVALEDDGSFVAPRMAEAQGAVLVFITLDDSPVSDDNIVAGPALVMFDSSSQDIAPQI